MRAERNGGDPIFQILILATGRAEHTTGAVLGKGSRKVTGSPAMPFNFGNFLNYLNYSSHFTIYQIAYIFLKILSVN